MDIQKKKDYLVKFAFVTVILALFYVIFKYGIIFIMPFVIAFIVASILKPVVGFFHRKLKISRKLGSIIFVVLFYGIIGFLILLLIIQITSSVKALLLMLPDAYNNDLLPAIEKLFTDIGIWIAKTDPDFVTPLRTVFLDISVSMGDLVTKGSTYLMTQLTSYATTVPKTLLDIVVVVIATYFTLTDYDLIQKFVMGQMSENNQVLYKAIKKQLGKTVVQYIRAYVIIFAISYCELAVGLLLIGIRNPFLYALLVAVFDILPIVGSGMILLPWTIITFIEGNIARGVGLAILYLFIVIARQIIEPKVIGEKVGMHPVLALLSMILGARLFGVIGLFGVPLTVAMVISLNNSGAIHLYTKRATDSSAIPQKSIWVKLLDKIKSVIKKKQNKD
ncbi:MAG: sporulation integral membrane protein YtvI [Clostridia bacterium]|jgi:sporulation integral membrane protein YtvI